MTTLTLVSVEAVTADLTADRRTITGLAVPYGVRGGNTSAGPLTVDAGSLTLPADLSRVKLIRGHDRENPAGYAIRASESADGLTLAFRCANTPAGDTALLEASEHVRDGLSVELDDAVIHNGHVTAGRLVAVAQCAVPAFDDARVSSVAASAAPDLPDPNTLPGRRLPDADPDPDPDPADPPADPEPTGDPADPERNPDVTETVTAGRAPATSSVSATARTRPGDTLAGAMELFAAYGRGEVNAGTVRAALVDIVPANDAGGGLLGQPAWIGELWSATISTRPLIDSITTKPLPATGLKVAGWKWLTRPGGAPYAGSKADIHSQAASTGPAEATIERWAGGNDIDRIFIDRGDASFRSAYFAAMAEDYAIDSEAIAVADLLAGATAGTGGLDLISLIVNASTVLGQIGAVLSFVGVAPDVYGGAFGIKASDAPWLLTGSSSLSGMAVNVGGVTVFSDPGLAAGTALAGDKRAATWWENPTPIAVESLDTARGGIDYALFAYHADMINDPRALLSYAGVTGAPVVPPVEDGGGVTRSSSKSS